MWTKLAHIVIKFRLVLILYGTKDILSEIIKVSIERLYRSPMVQEIVAAGFEVLGGLLESYTTASYKFLFQNEAMTRKEKSVFTLLPVGLRNTISAETTTYGMLRLILDYVSGLTDRHAIGMYRKMKGIALPGSGWPG